MSLINTVASILTIALWILSLTNQDPSYKAFFVFSAVFILIWLTIIFRLKEIKIYGDYRLKNHPNDRELKKSRLSNSGEIIKLAIYQNSEYVKSRFCRLLVWLGFKLVVIIKWPIGVNVNFERNNTDFKRLEIAPNKLVLFHEPNIGGWRKITIFAEMEPIRSFEGGDSIDIDLYISYTDPILRLLCMGIIGSRCSITIDIN